MRYDDKTVLITGASAGIGEGFAKEFHKLGAFVLLLARRKERLEKLAEELEQIRQGSTEVVVADLTSQDDKDSAIGLNSLTDLISNKQIDILVSNAGCGSFGAFDSMPFEREQQQVELNVLAPLKLIHAVIPQMKARGSGNILCVSSIAGFQPLPYMSTYSATKAFNFSQGLSLRNELRSYGINVLTICPGPVPTEFGEVAGYPRNMAVLKDKVTTVVKTSIRAMEQRKAVVKPGPVSKLASFFCNLVPIEVSTWLAGNNLRKRL